MREDNNKHLEFAQSVITRMGQNSFLIKGWTIGLVSALFALSAKDSNQEFIFIAYFPAIMFWFLDSYFLYQERLFRKTYDDIRKGGTVEFSLSTKKFDKGLSDWAAASFSKTILLFYGAIIGILIIIILKH